MSDDSGTFPKIRRNNITVPSWILTLFLTAMGGVSTYAALAATQSARMAEYERRDQERAADVRANQTELATHTTELAVYRERLDAILVELGQIKAQLQRAEDERVRK